MDKDEHNPFLHEYEDEVGSFYWDQWTYFQQQDDEASSFPSLKEEIQEETYPQETFPFPFPSQSHLKMEESSLQTTDQEEEETEAYLNLLSDQQEDDPSSTE